MATLQLFTCFNPDCGLTSVLRTETSYVGALSCVCMNCSARHTVARGLNDAREVVYTVTGLAPASPDAGPGQP